MHEIRFERNYNNKLWNLIFRTLRPAWKTYVIGNIYQISCYRMLPFRVKVIGRGSAHSLEDLSDDMTLLDAGVTVEEFYRLFERFYGTNELWRDWRTQVRAIYLKRMDPMPTILDGTATSILQGLVLDIKDRVQPISGQQPGEINSWFQEALKILGCSDLQEAVE